MRSLQQSSRYLRLFYFSIFMGLSFLCCVPAVSAQTWRGTYCVAWNHTLTPTRVVWATHLRGGQQYQITLPTPTNENSVQWLALSWGTDMSMPDTVCDFRVVAASEATLLSPPNSAQLWEIQLLEVDVIEVGPNVTRPNDMREIVLPASIQKALNWALRGDFVLWLIGLPLGAYLAREWIWAILRALRVWNQTSTSGDEEWERYNEEHGIYFDETEREFKRVAHRE